MLAATRSRLFPRLALLLLMTGRSPAAEHTADSLEAIQQAIRDQTAVLLDVREINEWNAGHLRDARLIPLSRMPAAIQDGSVRQTLPAGKIIYCHCKAGHRCLRAADILRAAGYDVRPLKPGYDDLVKAGFPVASDK